MAATSTKMNNSSSNSLGGDNSTIVTYDDEDQVRSVSVAAAATATAAPPTTAAGPVIWTAETADWYATNFGDAETNRMAVDYLLEHGHMTICQSMVVDIGCGTGTALRYIAQQLPTSRMTLMGVDVTPRMLEHARQRTNETCPTVDVGRLQWRLAPAEDMPLSSNSANVMLALDVLDHVSHLDRVFTEVLRILKPGGVLAIGKDASMGEDSNMELHLQCARNMGLIVLSNRRLTDVDDNVTMDLAILKKP